MASNGSADAPRPWPGRVIQHDEFAAALTARRAALGDPAMPRNAGNRRTASKQALLKAIEDAGGTW